MINTQHKTLTEYALDHLFSVLCPKEFLDFLKTNYSEKFSFILNNNETETDPIQLIEIADITKGIRFEVLDFMRYQHQAI